MENKHINVFDDETALGKESFTYTLVGILKFLKSIFGRILIIDGELDCGKSVPNDRLHNQEILDKIIKCKASIV
ncbi:MAG: hypothetical protein MHPSP_002127 [Paramarteilia canceri]